MEQTVSSKIEYALRQLAERFPGTALLALGQTIYWDEPMKAGVALAAKRLDLGMSFIAGVHDTDYFAKLPSGQRRQGQFRSLPHNDTTTRGLWSAAAEFSTLFGSETVVTRDILQAAGLKLSRLRQARPNILDEATEAWGWRGVVSLDDQAPITAQVNLRGLFPVLRETLQWAVTNAADSVVGENRPTSAALSDRLQELFCQAAEGAESLAELYERLLPQMYSICAGEPVPLSTTRTTELLKFNRSTSSLPRFELLALFVDAQSRSGARIAYDEAIRGGSGQYGLDRFGTGAIPFDIIIPKLGRGTIRIGNRGIVFMTPKPQFISLRKPLSSLSELAGLIEDKFGPHCTIIGKAVALIGMLAREYTFVFHEGASSYVKSSRKLHELLAKLGHPLEMRPILRIRYSAWDALSATKRAWFRLPEPFSRAFGTEELCASSFAGRWRGVVEREESLLALLATLRRPIDLIRFLDRSVGGSWNLLAEEYEGLHKRLKALEDQIREITQSRFRLYDRIKELKETRVRLEIEKGIHFREFVFEKPITPQATAERGHFTQAIEATIQERNAIREELRKLRTQQVNLVNDAEVQSAHERRQGIELEAELKRMRMIRGAVTASKGLIASSHRPSAWWFPVVSPSGLWFRQTIQTADAYLEELC
jgi:hypothetical protein